MANTVDERIVAAKFDASDFEKGVDKTVKKLDELKKSLNLKDSGKNITEFAKETTEGVEKVGTALERLSDRITTFKGMIKQQLLSGLASQVSNVFMAIERSAVSLANQLGSQQVTVGMSKYTELLNSVRTLTVSGIDQGTAYKQINRLQLYSDQTNASLESMVGLMTKLKTSGASLDSARKTVEGFSNAAASLGVNMANWPALYTNFAQAYGKGSLKLEDWKTFQSFNMVGETFTQRILDAAVAVGTLTKSQDGLYQANTKYGKEIKRSGKFAADQWENLLSSGFFNKKVMDKVFGESYYFDQIKQEELDMIEEMTEAERKAYFEENGLDEFAYKSFKAGQEARSLTDAMNTLKNAISTGWSKTFEIIFGKLDKATEFFTWLSDNELVNAIRKIGDFRNEILTAWGVDYGEGGIFRRGIFDEDGNLKQFGTGRDMLLQGLKNIDEMIGIVREGLESLIPEGPWSKTLDKNLTFAEKIGYNLAIMSKRFKESTERTRDFFTTFDQNGKRVLKPEYLNVLKSIGTVIGSVASAAGSALGVINKLSGILGRTFAKVLVAVSPIIESVGKAIGSLFEPIKSINENGDFFQNIENSIDNLLTTVQPLIDVLAPVIEFLGKVGGFFAGMAIDTIATNIEIFADALGFIIELFGGTSGQKANEGVGVIEGWGKSLEEFADSCKEGLKAIKEFFSVLFGDLRTLFGLGNESEAQNGGFFEGIKNFFDTNEFVQNVENFIRAIPSKMKGLGTKIWNNITDFLFGKKVKIKDKDPVTGKMSFMTMRVKQGFSLWLANTINNVKSWLKSIPGQFTDLWSTISDFLFGKEVSTEVVNPQTGETKKITTRVKQGFSKWLDDTVESVKGWFKSVPGKISGLWSKIMDFFFGKEVETTVTDPETGEESVMTTRVKEGFSKWLDETVASVKAWITTVPEKFGAAWTDILAFFFGKEVETTVTDPETGEESVMTTRVKEGFSKWLADTTTSVKAWIEEKKTALSGLWTDILDHIFGKTEQVEGGEVPDEQRKSIIDAADESLKSIGIDIGALFTNLPTYIASGISTKLDMLGELFSHVEGWFKRRNEAKESGEVVKNVIEDDASELAKEATESDTESPFMTALITIGQKISGLITNTLPGMLAEAFTFVKNNGGEWWKSIEGMLGLDGFDWSTIDQGAQEIGTKIAEYIEKIPDTIRTAVKSIKGLFIGKSPFEEAKEKITKQFTDQNGNIIDERAYVQALENAARTLSKEPGKTGLYAGISEIGSSLKDAFIDLGPDILDGVNVAINWIGTALTNFTNLLAEKPDEQPFGEWLDEQIAGADTEQSELAKSIQKIGETLKNLIVNIIPNFIQEGFKEVAAGIPRLLTSLFGEDEESIFSSLFGESEKEKEDAQKAADNIEEAGMTVSVAGMNATSLVVDSTEDRAKALQEMKKAYDRSNTEGAEESLTDFGKIIKLVTGAFDDVDVNTAAAAAKVAAIAALVWGINKIIDNLIITDDPGYNAKWEAIKIAILGIVAILGWITYLASQPDANIEGGRLDNVMKTLGKLGDFIKEIGEIIKWITIIMAGKEALETIGDFAGSEGSIWGDIVKILLGSGIIAAGGSIIGEGFNALWDSLAQLFSDLGRGVEDVVSFLAPSIEELAGMNAKLEDAIGAVGKTVELIRAFKDLVNGNSNEGDAIYWGTESDDVSLIEFQTEHVNRLMETFYYLGGAIHSLALGLNSFDGDIEQAKTKIASISELFASDEFGTMLQNLSDTIFGISLPGQNDYFIAVTSLIASAMNVFSEGIATLDESKVQSLTKFFDLLGDLSQGLQGINLDNQGVLNKFVNGDKTLTTFGKTIQRLGVNLKSFFQKMYKLEGTNNDAEIKITRQRIDLVVAVAEGLAEAVSKLQYVGDGSEIDVFAQKMEGFGSSIGKFLTNVNQNIGEGIDMNRINMIATGVNAIANLASGIGSMSGLYAGDIPEFISQFLKGIAENFTGENDLYTVGLTAGSNLDKGLAAGINSGAAILAAKRLAGAISGSFRVSWQMHSPSKLFATFGKNLNAGLEKGMGDSAKGPIESATDIAQGMVDAMRETLGIHSPSLEAQRIAFMIATGLLDTSKYEKKIEEAYSEMGESATEGLRQATGEALASNFGQNGKTSWFDVALKYIKSRFGLLNDEVSQKAEETKENFSGISEESKAYWASWSLQAGAAMKKVLNNNVPDNMFEGLNIKTIRWGVNAYKNINRFFKGLKIYNGITGFVDNVKDSFGAAKDGVKNGIDNTIDIVKKTFTKAFGEENSGWINKLLFGEPSDQNQDEEKAEQKGESYVERMKNILGSKLKNLGVQDASGAETLIDNLFGTDAEIEKDVEEKTNLIADSTESGLSIFGKAFEFLNDASSVSTEDKIKDTISMLESVWKGFALNKDNSPVIKPKVDMTNIDQAEKKINNLDFLSTVGFDTRFITELANAANPTNSRAAIMPMDYSGFFSSIKSELENVGKEITASNNRFTGLQVVLDSGALVGGIIHNVDKEMGRREFYARREEA